MTRLRAAALTAILLLAACAAPTDTGAPTAGAPAATGPADSDPARALRDQARLANSRGDFASAERTIRRLLDAQTRGLPANAPQIGETLLMLAAEVANQDRAEEADALVRRVEETMGAGVDAATRARLALDRAYMAAARRETAQSRRLAKEASDGFLKLAADAGAVLAGGGRRGPMRASAAQALLLESAMALAARDPGDAERAVRQALRLLDTTPGLPPWWRPAFLMQASAVAAARDRPDDAEQFLLTALALREKLLGNGAATAAVHMALGRHYHNRGMLLEALASFRRGIAILEGDPLGAEELVVDRLLPYLDTLFLLSGKFPAEADALRGEMFRAAQTLQTGVAAETIELASARLTIDDPSSAALAQKLADARRRRDAIQQELGPETIKPASLRDRAREARLTEAFLAADSEVAALETRQRAEFPQLSRLGARRPIAERDIQARLAPDEALVSFVIGRDLGFVLLVRHDRLKVAEVDLDAAQAAERVSRLRDAFTPRGGQLPPFDLGQAHDLHRRLLGGVAADLAGVGHLAVVTNGPLAALPPALLVTEPPRAGDYRGAAWLIRATALSTAPSIRAFMDMRAARARPTAPEPFLGFGDPRFEGARGTAAGQGLAALSEACREGAMDPELIRALDPLPDTASELARISAVFGQGAQALRLGAQANEAEVRRAPLDRYRVVYFATHGLLPGELKCQARPGLALSPPPRGAAVASDDDGMLDADEIATLKFNADLVVLSACNTAAGRGGGRFGGEALSGLAEAFFYAGAKSLLVTHWQVPSAETTALTVGMFETLGPRMAAGVADALRQSQLRQIATGRDAHPFFWAAFTLAGDGGAEPAEIDRRRGGQRVADAR
jgi:CHAT domain-containing protein